MEHNEIEEDEFGFSRNYFLAKEIGNSGKKSAHKLSDINLADEQELRDAVVKIEQKHEKEIDDLMTSYKILYQEWVLELRCGFGLLMYGFGSKRTLLEDFASTALTDFSVVVINGYLQSINLKLVVIALAEIMWDLVKTQQKITCESLCKHQQPFSSGSMDDLIAFLDASYLENIDCFVCVMVHNIDGPGLRDPETQHYLSRIAACSNIRIIASIDHVNALVLWDKKMVHTQLNWYWHHVPTFAPYKVEATFWPLILAQSGSSQIVKTAAIVLQSLTPNAQSVFKVVAKHQIAHPDEEGMPINNLYAICRERFLVSSQLTLNSHLTEFKDHELVKTRRDCDGQEYLYIPIPNEALEKIMQEISQ